MILRPGLLLYLFLLATFTLPKTGQAQLDRVIPLYDNTLLSAQVDTVSINSRIRLAQHISAEFPDSARLLYLLAYRESREIGYHNGACVTLNRLGLLYQDRGLYDSALYFYQKAIAHPMPSGVWTQIHIPYINIGNIHSFKGRYELALENYFQAFDLVSRYKLYIPTMDSFKIYNNMVLLWQRLGNSARAKDALDVVEGIVKRLDSAVYYAYFYTIAGGLSEKKDSKQSVVYYLKALELGKLAENPEIILPVLNTLANRYTDRGQKDSAHFYLNEAFELLERYPQSYTYERLRSWDNLGDLSLLEGNVAAAEQMLNTVFKQVQAIGLIDIMLHVEPTLAHVYTLSGKYQQAYEHMRHYALMKDTILEEQKTKSTDFWLRSHLAEKDKLVLEQKLQITAQESQLKVKNLWIGGSIMGAGFLLVTLIAIARSYRHKQKLQFSALKQLQQEQEINQLKALVRGEEQERNRIAIELHDGIASELWGIKLNVGTMWEQEKAGDFKEGRWESVYRQLDHTAQRVRTTAHNLMPDLLLDEGLAPALATLCQRMKMQTGLEVEFQEYGHIGRMNEEMELSVYRMIQELIQNALKHAEGATHLLVQLSCTERLLNITVEDNGVGFAEKDQQKFSGFGLGNIKKRVAALQGHFELKSQPREGTTAYLEFDLQYLL